MAERNDEETSRKSGIAYAAAIALFAAVAVFSGLGWLLDRWLGTAPWFLAGGVVVGAAAGFFEFIRLSSRTY
jgi:ATP synthase protein I